eukprot:gene13491-19349_t
MSAVSMLITKVLLDKKPTHGSGSFVSTGSRLPSRDLAINSPGLSGTWWHSNHGAPNFPATAPAVKPAADLGAQLLCELLPQQVSGLGEQQPGGSSG